MGAKLADVYAQVAKEFGLQGRVKLAMLTKIPSDGAAAVEDSIDNVRKFEEAVRQIREMLASKG